MSNLARNIERQQQVERTNENQKQLRIKKSWLTPGEKIIGIAFAGLVCFGSLHLISNQSQIYKVNNEIQKVEAKVNEQKKVNNDLMVQVSEMSRYDRIKKEAEKKGLTFNKNNVKVVPD